MITAEEFFTAKNRKQQNFHHNVYVIELDKKVMKDRKFRAANPACDPEKTCFYVGATGMSPEMRFVNHKRGYKSNRFAKKFGVKLRPDMYEFFNPMPWKAATELETELAAGLREKGHAVWQN